VNGPRPAAEALAGVDFLARLADAWDGRGPKAFSPPLEHRAIAALGGLDPKVATVSWRELTPYERGQILFGARMAVDLGRACAWTFGEGGGA